jgi:putative ABC transport system substrate-binding protein
MRRREFIGFLGGAAAMPFMARAQDAGKIHRIGFLGPAQNNGPAVAFYRAFLDRMSSLGFRGGQNLNIEFRALEEPRAMAIKADELVRARPDVIVATGPEAGLRAIVNASGAIPVVMVAINFDPIAGGYVKSLAHPGGSVTGVVFQQLELAQKQVELLTHAVSGKSRLAILFESSTADQLGAAERAAKFLKLDVQTVKLEAPAYDFDAAIKKAGADGAQLLLVLSGPGFTQHRARIAELAIQHRLPAMFIARHYVDAGGLISYGADFPVMFRRAADYAARILKGAKPAELPVEQATKFELVVNLKTAKAIGLTIPSGLLNAADEVIE